MMFAVQAAVLLSASKIEFATYSLVYSYVVMGQAVLSALFGGPLITLLSHMGEDARKVLGTAALRLQLLLAGALGAFSLAMAVAIGLAPAVAALAVLVMVGLSFRDAQRSVLASQLELGKALNFSLWFAVVTVSALGTVWLATNQVSPAGALAALATGALGTLARPIARALTSRVRLPRDLLERVMAMAIWSVPGAMFSWLQNGFYLTLVALSLSLSAVGEISAARMIAMPILIMASGLLRLAQVQAGRRLAAEGAASAIRNARQLALTCVVVGVLVATACWILDSVVDRRWLPSAYPHLLSLAGAWLAFVAATTARGVFTSLFQAMGRYRELFLCGAFVLPFVLGGVVLGPFALGLPGAVLPMVLGELALLALLAARAQREPRAST
ncbi:hypothetical protein [Sphingobium yanoikuyae]|nr:hypothetical protein [Sphingobium yanoikuyae]